MVVPWKFHVPLFLRLIFVLRPSKETLLFKEFISLFLSFQESGNRPNWPEPKRVPNAFVIWTKEALVLEWQIHQNVCNAHYGGSKTPHIIFFKFGMKQISKALLTGYTVAMVINNN